MDRVQRIGRRIYTTTAEVVMYNDDNELEIVEVHFVGNYNDKERVSKKLAQKLGTVQVIVKDFTVTSKFYSMTMEDFIAHADKITD